MGTATHIHPPNNEGLRLQAMCLNGTPALWLVIEGDGGDYVAEVTIHFNNRDLSIALAKAINATTAEITDNRLRQEISDD